MLDDDEAIAVSVALRDLSAEADPTLGEAALSASAKLRQVLPAPLRDRVDALGEVVVGVRRTRTPRPGGADERVELPSLMPDAGALVAEGVAVRVFDTRARVKVMAPAQEVAHHIGPTVGVIEPGDDTFC